MNTFETLMAGENPGSLFKYGFADPCFSRLGTRELKEITREEARAIFEDEDAGGELLGVLHQWNPTPSIEGGFPSVRVFAISGQDVISTGTRKAMSGRGGQSVAEAMDAECRRILQADGARFFVPVLSDAEKAERAFIDSLVNASTPEEIQAHIEAELARVRRLAEAAEVV